MIPESWKIYLDIGGAICFAILVFLVVHHLETVGEDRIKAQDAAALQADHAKMLEQQSQMQAQADKAEATRDATQKQLTDYMASNPIGHVFVCHQGDSKPRVPGAPVAGPGNAGSGTGPATVPEVSSGTDIGAGLDTLMRAAGTMAGLYREWQDYPTSGEVSQKQ